MRCLWLPVHHPAAVTAVLSSMLWLQELEAQTRHLTKSEAST